MMGAHAILYRHLEGDVGMVVRFIDAMDEWWALIRARGVLAMADGAVGCKQVRAIGGSAFQIGSVPSLDPLTPSVLSGVSSRSITGGSA